MAKITCPFCKTQFYPGFSSLAKWCRTDEFYVCRRCARQAPRVGLKCPRCGGGVSNPATFAIVMGLVLALGTSVVAVPSYDDLQLRWELQRIPVSTGPLLNNTLVRVHGTILGPPGTVVLDGQYQHSAWVWSGQNFNFSYGSSVIPVDVSWMLTYGMVFSYGHRISDNERQYQAGDAITLVGQAGTTNWSYPFVASEVAPYPYTFMDLGHAGADAGFVAVPLIALAIAVVGLGQTAWRKHRESVRWGPDGPHLLTGEGRASRGDSEPLPVVPLGERRKLGVRLPASRGSPPRYLDRRGSALWGAGVVLFAGFFVWEFLLTSNVLATPPQAEFAVVLVGSLVGGMVLQLAGARPAHVVRMVQCQECSTWNRPYTTSCKKCGAVLTRPTPPITTGGPASPLVAPPLRSGEATFLAHPSCSECGRDLAQPWKICPYCGARTSS